MVGALGECDPFDRRSERQVAKARLPGRRARLPAMDVSNFPAETRCRITGRRQQFFP
jgi:hypothetical protein